MARTGLTYIPVTDGPVNLLLTFRLNLRKLDGWNEIDRESQEGRVHHRPNTTPSRTLVASENWNESPLLRMSANQTLRHVMLLTNVEASCNIPHENIIGTIGISFRIHTQCIHYV